MVGKLSDYFFRDIHPKVNFGTASDRYAGWIGQIYHKKYKVTSRTKTLGKQKFTERVIEVKSVEEYFKHFNFLEIDFTFYNTLLNENGEPTPTFHVLSYYNNHIPNDGSVVLKVPQMICARKTYQRENGKSVFKKNDLYHNPELFARQFYEPACEILGEKLGAMIFEYEYQRKDDCPIPELNILDQQDFFDHIPNDSRYHIEERTDRLKTPEYFEFLSDNNIGNVFSHWTYLPTLNKQFIQAGNFIVKNEAIIRLLTPREMNYQQTYSRYQPFDKLLEEFPEMYQETVQLILEAIDREISVYVVVNNRIGGNAPEITRKIADLLQKNLN